MLNIWDEYSIIHIHSQMEEFSPPSRNFTEPEEERAVCAPRHLMQQLQEREAEKERQKRGQGSIAGARNCLESLPPIFRKIDKTFRKWDKIFLKKLTFQF